MLSDRMLQKAATILLLSILIFIPGGAYAAIEVTATSNILPGQAVPADTTDVVVYSLNAVATAGESAALQHVEIDVYDDGLMAGGEDADPDTITPEDFASFTVYRDNPLAGTNGVFDELDIPLKVEFPPFDEPVRTIDGLVFTVKIDVNSTIPVNDTGANQGDDFFIVMGTSSSISADDTFLLNMPAQASYVFNRENSTLFRFPPVDVPTELITVVENPQVSLTVAPLPTANQGILPRSGPTEIYGINATAPDDDIYLLSSVTIRVDDVGEVDEDGLMEITPSDFLSIAIYRDGASEPVGRNGVFDPPNGKFAPDTLVTEFQSPFGLSSQELYGTHTPFYITVPVEPDNFLAILPTADQETEAGDDFFVVIRTSDTIDSDFDYYGFSQVDDFTFAIEPLSVSVTGASTQVPSYFPPATQDEIVTASIVTEALALDLQPQPMDRTDYISRYAYFPGSFHDDVDGNYRYYYSPFGQYLRLRFLGERDTDFTGLGQDIIESVHGQFEQPVVKTIERRHAVIGLDIAGGTKDTTEYLDGITLTFSNLGSTLVSLRDFDPLFGIDFLRDGLISDLWGLFFSGIAVYADTNGNGVYDEPNLDEDFNIDPATGDQPLEFEIIHPGGFGTYPYISNVAGTHYMLRLRFIRQVEVEMMPDKKPDFFIVMRLDSGRTDDSGHVGDGTSVNFGADFKVSLERAEDYNGDGIPETSDLNGDGLVQPPPVIFRQANPREGLTILADNSPDPQRFLEARKTDAVIDGQDLSLDNGCDLPWNDPGCTAQIVQRIDATSIPTALVAINAATSDIPVPHPNMIEEPVTISEIRLNFSGDGFEPSDIKDVLLVRDDKSPYNAWAGHSVGVFDIFNDLWNYPPPEASPGDANNPKEESPIPVTAWQWQNDGSFDYLVLKPVIPPPIYPNDELDETVDTFTDNFEMIPDEVNPGHSIPKDTVFSGADYFIVVETSDTISYDDEIKVQIPKFGVALSNGLTVLEGASFINPEDRYSSVRSVRANVPVVLHDLVAEGQELGPNSGYVPVLGFNMYTNRPPASQGGVDVYFEQLVIAFLQYGTRDTINLASDFLPFENVNEAQTANSGIQLYRDANGNGKFDGPTIDTLVRMDNCDSSLRINPSRVGLAGDEANQVLFVFSSTENRQLVPPTDTGSDAGDDFFLVIRTSPTFDPFEDNFSVAVISWGPDSPFAPAPNTIDAGGNRPYDAISFREAFPWGRRGIGFLDSNGIRTRSNETINTNVFNATRATMLNAVTDFASTIDDPQVKDPTHQVVLTWTDTNSDNASTPYVNENETGYWIESDLYGIFQPLAQNPLPADLTAFFFDGPAFLAGKTVQFRILPFRDNIFGNPLYPPFNGPGPAAVCEATFWPSPRPQPIAYFSTDVISGCSPLAVHFSDGSIGNPATWSWNFGDGSALVTSQSPTHSFTSAGTFEVCLTATNSYGSDTYCKEITVNSVPDAKFTANRTNTCVNQPVQFMDTSTGNPHTFLWNFGDGSATSNLANPEHSYTRQGTFTVTLTASNDCGSDTETKTGFITVATGLIADFSFSPIDGCAPVQIQFVDGSTCEATSWLWDFGDGITSTSQNPSHLYSAPGTYHVCLTVGNGTKTHTACKDVVIYNCIPEISVSVTSLNPSCKPGTNAGQQTFSVRNSGIGVLSYVIYDNAFWLSCSPTGGSSSGDAKTITVTYSTAGMAPGIYNATITVSAAGSANSPQYINVRLQVGDFELTKINLVSPSSSITAASPPTFSWRTNGGSRNAFSVEVAFNTNGPWFSTYVNLKEIVYGNSYTMTSGAWNRIQSGRTVYWRVRGRDLDKEPQTIITSDEVWNFVKK